MGEAEAQADERDGSDGFEGTSNGEVRGDADQRNDHHLGKGTADEVTDDFVPEFRALGLQPCSVGVIEFAVVRAAPTGTQRRLAMRKFHDAVAEFHFSGFADAFSLFDQGGGSQHKQQEYGDGNSHR